MMPLCMLLGAYLGISGHREVQRLSFGLMSEEGALMESALSRRGPAAGGRGCPQQPAAAAGVSLRLPGPGAQAGTVEGRPVAVVAHFSVGGRADGGHHSDERAI